LLAACFGPVRRPAAHASHGQRTP
jgi:hypothetical protein